MKRLLFLFLLISFSLSGQNFDHVDTVVKTYPRYTSPQQLADKISKDFSSDLDRVRASFKWITQNIRYSLEYYFHNERSISFSYTNEREREIQLQKIRDKIVKDAFVSKTGVCEEYAQSLKKLCDLMGIESILLKGYVRNNASEISETPQDTNHVWNAVKINDKWIFIDATWAAGFVVNGKWEQVFSGYFFDIPRDKIGLTHYPYDKKWQLVLNSGTLKDFYSQPIYHQYLLDHNIEIMSPKKGIISANEDNEILIKLKNLPSNARVSYYYQGQRYSDSASVAESNGIQYVRIPAPSRNGELYIFIDRISVLEYKVIHR